MFDLSRTYDAHSAGPRCCAEQNHFYKSEHMLDTSYNLSDNSDISRVSFIVSLYWIVIDIYIPAAIAKAFFCDWYYTIWSDSKKLKSSNYPFVENNVILKNNSPNKVTCSKKNNVELHPLVCNTKLIILQKKQSSSQRIITSDEAREQVAETEKKKEENKIKE